MMKDQMQIDRDEAEHHDRWARSVDAESIQVERAMNSCSAPENRQILEWMGSPQGKKILELGAGLGEASIYFAQRGADVTATDISPGMLEKIQDVAKLRQVSLKTQVASANDLSSLPPGDYDVVYAANLLHHVNVQECLHEVSRRIGTKGTAYFWDPILYNPVIQIYRRMAVQVRTEDEHPLTRKDFQDMRMEFRHVEIRHFWMTTLVIFLKYFLIDRIHPNQSRYWKKILDDADDIRWWMEPAHRVDAWFFKYLPFLKYFSWNVAVRATNAPGGFKN